MIKRVPKQDPFDLKLRDRFVYAEFAYHNPSARLTASLTERVKRSQAVFRPLPAPGSEDSKVNSNVKLNEIVGSFRPYILECLW